MLVSLYGVCYLSYKDDDGGAPIFLFQPRSLKEDNHHPPPYLSLVLSQNSKEKKQEKERETKISLNSCLVRDGVKRYELSWRTGDGIQTRKLRALWKNFFLMADADFMVWSLGLSLLILEGRVPEVAKQRSAIDHACFSSPTSLLLIKKSYDTRKTTWLWL